MSSVPELIDFAVHAVQLAGVEILKYFRSTPNVHNKAQIGFDPVTAADQSAEEIIRREIQRVFPDHSICGEEGGKASGKSAYTWYIDPIDGTRAFILGQLHWGTLLGCHDGERSLIGVMHQPYVAETFIGSPLGAQLRRGNSVQSLQTRSHSALDQAIVCATDPTMFHTPPLDRAFKRLAQRCLAVRWGGDCYTPCLLAAGQIDLVVESGLKPWDIQPLLPIVRAAGGIVTDWSGGPADESERVVFAATAELHAQAIAALAWTD